MILLRGVVVWWTAQVPQRQRPDRNNTNRAGIYDLDDTNVSALDLTRQQSNNTTLCQCTICYIYRESSVQWHLLVVMIEGVTMMILLSTIFFQYTIWAFFISGTVSSLLSLPLSLHSSGCEALLPLGGRFTRPAQGRGGYKGVKVDSRGESNGQTVDRVT